MSESNTMFVQYTLNNVLSKYNGNPKFMPVNDKLNQTVNRRAF